MRRYYEMSREEMIEDSDRIAVMSLQEELTRKVKVKVKVEVKPRNRPIVILEAVIKQLKKLEKEEASKIGWRSV